MMRTATRAALWALAVSQLAALAAGAAVGDEVSALPGWSGPLPSRHYSGYVDVSADPGTTPGRFLHYYLVEAEEVDPASAPLVLWLNGGPGCSSMEGLFSELGPLFIDEFDPTQLRRNPHTWARTATVVFLEAPIGARACRALPAQTRFSYRTDLSMWRTGVGFSYTTEGASFGDGVRPSLCVSVCLYVCVCVPYVSSGAGARQRHLHRSRLRALLAPLPH